MKVTQLCPILCNPVDHSTPGSPIHGILQARILEWVAIPLSSGSSQPRDQTQVSHITDFLSWTPTNIVSISKCRDIYWMPTVYQTELEVWIAKQTKLPYLICVFQLTVEGGRMVNNK